MQVGDWVVFDLKIGQIKKLGEDSWDEFSDGMFTTSGRLRDRFRPLTLRNKNIIETLDFYRKELNKIHGSQGFNFPRITDHFSQMSCELIDGSDSKDMYNKAREFYEAACRYEPIIQGVPLFRPV